MVEEPEIVLGNNSIESVIKKVVRKIFVVMNIYGVQPFDVLGVVGMLTTSLQSVTIKTFHISHICRIL